MKRAAPSKAKRREKRRILARLCEMQRWLCAYCYKPIQMREPGKKNGGGVSLATFDHIKPKSEGGGYSYYNGVAACVSCNCRRGIQDAEAYWEKKNQRNRLKFAAMPYYGQ